jgi:hypothetical protein
MFWEVFNAQTFNKFKNLLIFLKVSFKDIVLKESKFLESIREYHKSNAVLDTLEPVSPINIAINPIHLAIALS